jgi:hypothetical protein
MKPVLARNVGEANYTAQKESGEATSRGRSARLGMLLRCLLLIGAYLAMLTRFALCSDQPDASAASTSTAQSPAVAALTKRPVTVADSIQMVRLGDSSYTQGGPSKGIVAKFSPDGRHFVVILEKGNLNVDTNEYSLVLFQTAEVFQSPTPVVLVSLASSSNRPAINNVFWLNDNDTILFMGERPGESPQPYSLKCSSKELRPLTSSPVNITSFSATASGEVIVYAARNPLVSFLTASVSRKGIAVTNEAVDDLIRGSHGGNDYDDHSLFVKRLARDPETKIVLQGRIRDDHPEMSLSPDGDHLVIQTEAARVSNTWSEYGDQFLKAATLHPAPSGGYTGISQYELVDTRTGTSQVLLDAPIPSLGSELAWSPDSKSVVISDVYLPLNVDDPVERSLRRAHVFLAEVKIASRQFVTISDEDLRLLRWDSKTGDVVCDAGRIDSLTGKTTPKVYFRKIGDMWFRANTPEQTAAPPPLEIVLDEGMNTPPHIVAVDPPTGRKSLLMDLNSQFQNLALARVEEIAWKDAHGVEVKGGLYWPPDFVAGKKYPLIVQTHGWDSDRFWMDGPWTTAFAAQPLAGKGFFVVQVPDPDWHLSATPKEAPRAMAAYESAIDYLDRRGLIDRNRVGITGFSRTFWYVTYTLTHSKHHFAAADVADGVDYGYSQYMAFSNMSPSGDFEQVYGGPPSGKSMSRWLKQSPAFLMDKIETPLRIQTLYPASLLSDWHWYTGLAHLGKPVEMLYIPEGTHILEKPWERMTSQQGNVDWFCFWLKGEEDPDPTKAEQYRRWRELRELQGGTASAVNTP